MHTSTHMGRVAIAAVRRPAPPRAAATARGRAAGGGHGKRPRRGDCRGGWKEAVMWGERCNLMDRLGT